jgi:hypothetical protein
MKKTFLFLILIIASVSLFIGYKLGVYAQIQSSLKTVLEPGSLATEASYIVFTDGSLYYVRNGTTGEVEFQGTDATQAIQYAINASPTGHVHIKEGTYRLSNPLTLLNNKRYLITGSGYGTYLVTSGAGIFDIADSGSYPFWASQITIENLRIEAKTGFGIKCEYPNAYGEKCPWLVLRNMYIYAKYGIKLNTPYRSRIENVHVQCDNEVSGGIGIWLYQDVPWFHSGDSFFTSIYINMDGPNAIGLLIDASKVPDGTINLITFDKVMAYGHEDSIGIYLKANNASAGNIADIHFEAVDLEGWGTAFKIEGAPPPNVRGDIYAIHIQGEYWGATTCLNISGAVSADAHDIEFACENDIDTSRMYGTLNLYNCFKWGKWNVNLNENTHFYQCGGYTTENEGTASINAGETSTTIAHGLPETPKKITLTPVTSTGGRVLWVSEKNSTHFKVSIDSAYTSQIRFEWYAEI